MFCAPRFHSEIFNGILVPYVVGMHPNSPRNPHSAMASGGNDASDINGSPPVEAYTLYGAVVGGPDRQDLYRDVRDNVNQTEVRFLTTVPHLRFVITAPQAAIDYNAPLLTLAAMHVMIDTADPFYTCMGSDACISNNSSPGYPPSSTGNLKSGVIVLTVLFSCIGFGIFTAAIYGFSPRCCRRDRDPLSPAQDPKP